MNDSFQKLVKLAKLLRSEKGCPWDRAQTIFSVEKNVRKEAEEIKEAVAKKDWKNLKEELGDVLFNLIMIAQIAEEKKLFRLKEVLEGVYRKIKRRHSWVFGREKAKTKEEALKKWKENKKKEKP